MCQLVSVSAQNVQVNYMSHELEYMLAHAPDPSRNAVLASDAVCHTLRHDVLCRLHIHSDYIIALQVRAAAALATGRDLGLALGAEDAASNAGAGSVGDNRRAGAWSLKNTVLPTNRLLVCIHAVETDEPCAICFDDMGTNMALLTYCMACGNNMHKVCMQQWATAKRSRGEAVSCPYCRASWTDPSAANPTVAAIVPVDGAKPSKQGGFINLADVAGISKSRDTSTYHNHGYRRYSKGRGLYEEDYDE
jgi:hypothetical protein